MAIWTLSVSIVQHVSVYCEGDLPELLSEQDMLSTVENLSPRVENGEIDQGPLALPDVFTRECAHNLHLVICLSPAGGKFKNLLRAYPSLLIGTTSDWYSAWPSEALQAMAVRYT